MQAQPQQRITVMEYPAFYSFEIDTEDGRVSLNFTVHYRIEGQTVYDGIVFQSHDQDFRIVLVDRNLFIDWHSGTASINGLTDAEIQELRKLELVPIDGTDDDEVREPDL